MSVSPHHTFLLNHDFDEDVVHTVIDEPTPSPPPKPPRGILRKGAPMKPQRSAIKIDPIQNENKENVNQPPSSQFKAKDIMEQMQTYFKRSIAVIRRSEEEFTGAEAADVLTAYIQSHKNDFPRENVGRSNAVK
uniref:Uncharacterized protein n=1 Tax=Caenorhabditis japonica TaxID=281687 RepID=A0A8R1E1D9_CAEJA